MKYIFITFLLLIISMSCGKREDQYYEACNDGSGSNKCRTLDQQELAMFLKSERHFNYFQSAYSSQTRTYSDENVIQTFLLHENYFATSLHKSGYYTYFDAYVHVQSDIELTNCVDSYYGILREEGNTSAHYALSIYGRLRNNFVYNYCYRSSLNGQSTAPGATLKLYSDGVN